MVVVACRLSYLVLLACWGCVHAMVGSIGLVRVVLVVTVRVALVLVPVVLPVVLVVVPVSSWLVGLDGSSDRSFLVLHLRRWVVLMSFRCRCRGLRVSVTL